MVKHIVFFKLSDNGFKNRDKIISMLNCLKDDIEFIKELEVGINFAQSDRAYDISLIVVVDDKESLLKYSKHPKHIPVIEYLKSLDTITKVVDYQY